MKNFLIVLMLLSSSLIVGQSLEAPSLTEPDKKEAKCKAAAKCGQQNDTVSCEGSKECKALRRAVECDGKKVSC